MVIESGQDGADHAVLIDQHPNPRDALTPLLRRLDNKVAIVRAEVVSEHVAVSARQLSLKTVLNNEERFAFGKARVRSQPGRVLLSPRNVDYKATIDSRRPTQTLAIFFPDQLVIDAMSVINLQTENLLDGSSTALSRADDFTPHARVHPEGATLLARLWATTEPASAYDLSLRCLSSALEMGNASLSSEKISAARRSVRHELYRRITAARDLIDQDPAANLALPELARECSLSAFHLHRTFAAVYGLTPQQYRRRARLERAQSLLRETSLPIGEVARRVGFEDFSAFTRSFGQLFGETPGSFRTRAR